MNGSDPLKRRRNAATALVAVATWALVMLLVFRDPLSSGLRLGFGDRADSMIELAILEHWRNVWAGAANWSQTFYFFPYAATLGYNDCYLVSGLFYTVWRIGFDPFLAVLLTAATFRTIAFFSCLWLFARVVRVPWPSALLAASLFTIASYQYLQLSHGQFQVQALLPLLAGSTWRGVCRQRAGLAGVAMMYAAGSGLILALLFLTSFYIGWFALFYLVLFAIAALLDRMGARRPIDWRAARRAFSTISIGAATFGSAIAPLIWLYLPKLRESGGHSFAASFVRMLEPIDLVRLPPGNLLWGRTSPAVPADDILALERDAGIPFLLLSLILVSLVLAMRRDPERTRPAWARPLAVASIAAIALTTRIGGLNYWWILWEMVPGASALRVVARVHLVLILPFLLLVTSLLRWPNRWRLGAPLAFLLIAEQLTSTPVAALDRASLDSLLALPAPPRDCPAFVAIVTRPGDDFDQHLPMGGLYAHNVDAMLLAEWWRTPTPNGFSTFNPPDWNFEQPLVTSYGARVAVYLSRHHVTRWCTLDVRQSNPWSHAAL